MRYLKTLVIGLIVAAASSQVALAQAGDKGPAGDKGQPGNKGPGKPGDKPAGQAAGPSSGPSDKGSPGHKGHHPGAEGAAKGPGAADREDAKKAGKERRDEMGDATKEGHAHHDHKHHEFSEKFKKKLDEMRTSRGKRRDAHRALLKAKWGEHAEHQAPLLAEFRQHAWRMARLKRMLALAEELEKPDLVKRVNASIEKETARHEARLEKLKAEAPGAKPEGKPGAAPGAVSAAAPTPPPAAAPATPAAPASKE